MIEHIRHCEGCQIGMPIAVQTLAIVVLVLLLGGCAANGPSPKQYRAGNLEIFIFPEQELLVKTIPPVFLTAEATVIDGKAVKFYGWFDRASNKIYSIDDTETLIHELRHYLEPEWKH